MRYDAGRLQRVNADLKPVFQEKIVAHLHTTSGTLGSDSA